MDLFAQVASAATANWDALLFGWGPLGGISWWLARQNEKLRKENTAAQDSMRVREEARDKLIRETFHHMGREFSQLSRALIYNAAVHGHGTVKDMAERELARIDSPSG